MTDNRLTRKDTFSIPVERFARRRDLLREAIAEEATAGRGLRPRSSLPFHRIVVIATGLLLATAGSAIAISTTDFLGEQDRVDERLWTPPGLARVGPRIEVARGPDWSFMAWQRADGGLCVGYAAGDATDWSRTCGLSRPGKAGGIVTWALTGPHGAADGHGALMGATKATVVRVEVTFSTGRVVSTRTLAPGAFGADARLFIIRGDLPAPSDGIPLRALVAYNASGAVVEAQSIAK